MLRPESPETDERARRIAKDLRLVAGARGGDSRSFEELGERLRVVPRLLASANRRLIHPLQADELGDLAQDTILLIWGKLETFEGKGTLEAWVARFCRFEVKNRARSVARRHRRQGTSLDVVPVEPIQPAVESMPIDSEELNAAMARLPEEARAVITMKHHDGLMFQTIAKRLGIPESTAKTRYYRGLAKLRALLVDLGEGAEGGKP